VNAVKCILRHIAVSFFSALISYPAAWADIKAIKTGDSVVDAKALTIKGEYGNAINGQAFQQDAVASHKDRQYVAYYDANRRLCLARRRLPAGKWQIIRFDDYEFKGDDAHNTVSLGICPRDGTIHLAFDQHNQLLHYRVARKGAAADPETVVWEAAVFGPIASELEKGKPIRMTYPRFWQTPDGGLQFGYRQGGSGNGDRMLVDYDASAGTWINTRQIDSHRGTFEDVFGKSESRCSYPNGYTYGPKGILHATWVWREDSQGPNHDLMYAFSRDGGRTWLNNTGEMLTEPPYVGSPGLRVVEIGQGYGLMNTHGQAVDSQGRIHAVMWHCTGASLKAAGSKPGESRWGPPEARRYHHYWRDKSGTWLHRELPWTSGNRPKLFIDRNDDAFIIYGSNSEDLVIAAATAKSKWTDWKIIHVEKGPFGNEMLGDLYRWKKERVLSVMVQESPREDSQPTPLRILDFVFRRK